MRRLFFSLLMLAATCAEAQTQGLYLQISGGAHVAKEFFRDGDNSGASYCPGFQGGLTIGLTNKQWQFEAGLSIMHQLTKMEDRRYTFEDELDPLTGSIVRKKHDVMLYQKSTHVFLPVTVKYALVDNPRFRLSPMLSLMAGYRTSYKIKYILDSVETPCITPENYNVDVPKISFWAGVGVEACYNLSKRSTLIISPKVTYMLSNYEVGIDNRAHTLTFGADLGYRCYLKGK